MKRPSVLGAGAVMLCSTLLIGASGQSDSRSMPSLHPNLAADREPRCGGEPCAAVVRGALAFVDRRLEATASDSIGGRHRRSARRSSLTCASCRPARPRHGNEPAAGPGSARSYR